jgi:hypothetical protein
MGDDSAARTRTACSVNAFGADDGVRFNGNRRKEKRSQRSRENCLHEIKPLLFLGSRRLGRRKQRGDDKLASERTQLLICRIRAGGALLGFREAAVIDFADQKSAN